MPVAKARELFTAGDLGGAIAALTEAVKKAPTDQEGRGLLAEMLCIAGELDRADKQLDALANQDAAAAPALAMFRQVLRAELARRECFERGRAPEFIGPPSAQMERYLRALVLIREGELREAAALLYEAEEMRIPPKGQCNGKVFDDFRDLDDLSAAYLEVLTTTGSYYWVPLASVVSLEFQPPRRPRDLIWRQTHLMVHDGPEGEVYVPAIYANAGEQATDQARLGRITEWVGGEGTPVLGLGQRTFLVGEEAVPIMELEQVTFETQA
jgi:type VI secretion system protein ImpE